METEVRNDEVNKNHEQRMERIVSDYQKRIINNLNDEYTRTTKPSDRLADKIAQFGGS